MKDSRILIVDSDENLLKSIRNMLSDENFECITRNSPDEAVDYLAKHPVQIVVSPIDIKTERNVLFLEEVRAYFPDILRLSVSDYPLDNGLIQALDSGLVYRYISKPIRKKELLCIVQQMLELYELKNGIHRMEQEAGELEYLNHTSQVVHELRVPIQSIGSAVFLAKMNLLDEDPKHSDIKRYLDIIHSNTSAIRRRIGSLVPHSSEQELFDTEEIDVNSIIKDELDRILTETSSTYHGQTITSFGRDLPRLRGNVSQLRRIFSNLVINAIESMEKSRVKRLSISTRHGNGGISIRVGDTGSGIQEEDLSRIFSPKYSTKLGGKNSGLGLANVKKLVESYRGYIKVESEPGKNTIFTVFLPCTKSK